MLHQLDRSPSGTKIMLHTAAPLNNNMIIPSSTYRIQFHKDFPLRNLQPIIDYLHTLGVSTIYASPTMRARPGSAHGYDVTDPHEINPELGSHEELKAIIRELRKRDMSWLQDIVPNHMAFHYSNFRLMDVLERGPESDYYRYFDIDWDHDDPDLKGKVMVPFLGDELKKCVSEGQINISFTNDGLVVKYFDTPYPLSVPGYDFIADLITDTTLANTLRRISKASKGTAFGTWTIAKRELINAIHDVPRYLEIVNVTINSLVADEGIGALLETQYYRLCSWRETDRRINYRRFFTVNELICLRMEDDSVFDDYHKGHFKLFRNKLIDGFRIDHIDGLYDPAGYTGELRTHIGDGAYVIAEKILEASEDVPSSWPIEGTSGYEFLSHLNQLLTNRKGARKLLAFYRDLIPEMPSYHRLMFDSKRIILENFMQGEWNNLVGMLMKEGLGTSFPRERIRAALGVFMLSLPVYRIYPDALPLKGRSLAIIHEAFDNALMESPDLADELAYFRSLFTSGAEDVHVLAFIRRLMQFTGPLTAKGVEDTTFYIYAPLISHDEVGDSPSSLGMTLKAFHDKMQSRQTSIPLSLNATATHDTKRGEDARVRINVLSRMPERWRENVLRWMDMNSRFRQRVGGRLIPETNDEYFIYQSILGGFPVDLLVTDEWIQRVHMYLKKALREAKVNTNWSEPDEDYEKGCEKFVEQILDSRHTFLETFIPFVRSVDELAAVYSLSQILIKLTAPGIPDIYQGCELWDFSFVDPDNRRPVDFEKRMQYLFQLVVRDENGPEAVAEFLEEKKSEGIEKMFIIWKTLNFRKLHPGVFTEGLYVPVEITGGSVKAAAYARTDGRTWVLVVVPFGLETEDQSGIITMSQDHFLILPEDAPSEWTHIFTSETLRLLNQIDLADLFAQFPVALLVSES